MGDDSRGARVAIDTQSWLQWNLAELLNLVAQQRRETIGDDLTATGAEDIIGASSRQNHGRHIINHASYALMSLLGDLACTLCYLCSCKLRVSNNKSLRIRNGLG